MSIKIPCKKFGFFRINSLSLLILLLLASITTMASEVTGQDRALFWAIQRDGKPVGHLLGTIHSEDPRVLDFSQDFLQKLKDNSVFAMELIPDISTLTRLTEYMHYPASQTLESVLGAKRYAALVSALLTYGVSAEFINRMRPWAAMMTLSTPPPETGFFMDLSISLRASGNGLKVVGLETLEQQLSFLQEMPMSMQLELMDQAIAEFDHVQQVHDQMVDTYLENNLVELQTLSDEQLTGVSEEAGAYFMQSGIRGRNLRMAETLWPYLENKQVFIAVGALHLPGHDGLLNILRRRGYDLMPLGTPFSEGRVAPSQ